jgi:hypothetical protein
VYKLSRNTAVATAVGESARSFAIRLYSSILPPTLPPRVLNVLLATGVLAGWQFTQAFRSSTIAQIRAQRVQEAAQVQLTTGTPGDAETTAA